jgi:alkylation response protein AidB-like acyl-CoA dehydrogenase
VALLSDTELTHFADSTRRFVGDNYSYETSRALAASDVGYSAEMWKHYADLGWLGLPLTEEYGGAGGGAVELGILLEASGYALLQEPLLSTLAIGAPLVTTLGDQSQRQALLPAIAAGAMTIAFAHGEPDSGHERLSVTTRAVKSEGVARLSGRKRFVMQAAQMDCLLVSARAADGMLGLYIVSADAAGMALENYRAIDGRAAADIELDSVPAERLGSADASDALERIMDLATAALCAESMAIIARLNAATLEYARTRRQFGVPIGSFQVVQHRLVDMMTAEQEGWAITRCSQNALDDRVDDAWRIVSAAKARVDRAARFVAEQAIQLHGGIGMSDELMVGHSAKRLMLNASMLGDAQWHLNRLGQYL